MSNNEVHPLSNEGRPPQQQGASRAPEHFRLSPDSQRLAQESPNAPSFGRREHRAVFVGGFPGRSGEETWGSTLRGSGDEGQAGQGQLQGFLNGFEQRLAEQLKAVGTRLDRLEDPGVRSGGPAFGSAGGALDGLGAGTAGGAFGVPLSG